MPEVASMTAAEYITFIRNKDVPADAKNVHVRRIAMEYRDFEQAEYASDTCVAGVWVFGVVSIVAIVLCIVQGYMLIGLQHDYAILEKQLVRYGEDHTKLYTGCINLAEKSVMAREYMCSAGKDK